MKLQHCLTLDDTGTPRTCARAEPRAVAALLECGFRVIEVECRRWEEPEEKEAPVRAVH